MRGAEVTSIDIAPRLIEGCRYRSTKHSIPIDFRVINARRCLKQGGFLLLVEPQKYNPFVEVGRYFIKNKEDSRTPTEHPIVPKDIRLIKRTFGNLEKKEFELFKPMALAFEMLKWPGIYKVLVRAFTVTDHTFWYLPFFRPLYWQVVMKAVKE
jgi:SAM-dependent methyltransferase